MPPVADARPLWETPLMVKLRDGANKGSVILMLLVFAALLGRSFYRDFHHEPETLVACEFSRAPGARELAFPKGNRPIGKLRIDARFQTGDQPPFHSVAGSATWPARDESRPAQVIGTISLDKDGKVDGLALLILYPEFKSDILSISTLNRDGLLDVDRARAYLHFGRDDRFAFPVDYGCRIDRRPAHWGWS